tara:strand:+ start:2143 stop:2670 length:528 start_codon:yes stop_codon:yes gene_type:complete
MTEVNVRIDIGDAVETALGDIDVSDYIDMEYAVDNALSGMDLNDYIDNDDIRYAIEDDILNQVNDYIDNDDIRWNLEGHFADDDEFRSVSSDVQELQEQMKKLLEVINLPADPPSTHETITHAPLEDVRDIYMARREERYDTIRYMSKPELVAWAEENDYDVDGMTVKEIHALVL